MKTLTIFKAVTPIHISRFAKGLPSDELVTRGGGGVLMVHWRGLGILPHDGLDRKPSQYIVNTSIFSVSF